MSSEVATGINILKTGSDPALRPDAEVPEWLWELAQPDKPLSDLQRHEFEQLDFKDVRRGSGGRWVVMEKVVEAGGDGSSHCPHAAMSMGQARDAVQDQGEQYPASQVVRAGDSCFVVEACVVIVGGDAWGYVDMGRDAFLRVYESPLCLLLFYAIHMSCILGGCGIARAVHGWFGS